MGFTSMVKSLFKRYSKEEFQPTGNTDERRKGPHMKNVQRDNAGNRAGATRNMSRSSFLGMRFYGRSDQRNRILDNVDEQLERSKQTSYNTQTVDGMNKRIGIEPKIFGNGKKGLLTALPAAIEKGKKMNNDPEAKAWAEWISEKSRLSALMMPEMDAHMMKKEFKLDEKVKGIDSQNQADTNTPSRFQRKFDHLRKRVYVSDLSRTDKYSHFIDSGQKMTQNGKEYSIFWAQASVNDDMPHISELEDRYFHNGKWDNERSWSKGMTLALESYISEGNLSSEAYDNFRTQTELHLATKGSTNAKTDAAAYANTIKDLVTKYLLYTIPNRFFRLTSLMGQDFFTARGNKIGFTRDDDEKNFSLRTKGGRLGINSVITDTEWAHAQKMGYLGKSVYRYDSDEQYQITSMQ